MTTRPVRFKRVEHMYISANLIATCANANAAFVPVPSSVFDRFSLFHDVSICGNSTNISGQTWHSPGRNRCAWTSWPCCWTICQTWQLSWHRPRACARLLMLWKHFGRSFLAWQAWCTPDRNHLKKKKSNNNPLQHNHINRNRDGDRISFGLVNFASFLPLGQTCSREPLWHLDWR